MKISALNRSGVDVKKQLKLQLNGGVTNNTVDWANWIPPMEGDNLQSIDNSRNLIIYSSQKGDAHLLQGISGGVENINRFGIVKLFEIPAGEKREFYFSFRFFQYEVNHRSLFHSESKKHHFH